MDFNLKHPAYNLAKTAFFPLTGNPTGFHHLLLAECVLRQYAHVEQVVFILSNGKHPDPTKASAVVSQGLRQEILQKALASFGIPQKSEAAQRAQAQQECLQLNEKTGLVNTAEFSCDRPVPLHAHVQALLKNATPSSDFHAVQLVIGGDLVSRMSQPNIFSDLHLQGLAKHCQFLMASRNSFDLEKEAKNLEKTRHVFFNYQKIDLSFLPSATIGFFQLSSTLMRQASQAGHELIGFLPEPAAALIQKHKLYQVPPSANPPSEWQAACQKQSQLLDETAKQLKNFLDERHKQGLPHTFAFVETSTGGRLSAALGSLPGISKHFKESVILYDQASKNRCLGKILPAPAVSQEMALQLAKKFQSQTGADFVLCETGMAGPPEGMRQSQKQGLCEMALLVPSSAFCQSHQSNPFLSKKEHQLIFAHTALRWFLERLQSSISLGDDERKGESL